MTTVDVAWQENGPRVKGRDEWNALGKGKVMKEGVQVGCHHEKKQSKAQSYEVC